MQGLLQLLTRCVSSARAGHAALLEQVHGGLDLPAGDLEERDCEVSGLLRPTLHRQSKKCERKAF